MIKKSSIIFQLKKQKTILQESNCTSGVKEYNTILLLWLIKMQRVARAEKWGHWWLTVLVIQREQQHNLHRHVCETPHELKSTSPIKFTTPVTWQMSSTPLFGKRKLTLLEDSDSLDASSYKNGGRKKKCAGLLLYDDASSTKVEVLSCRTSLQSLLAENLR